MATLTITNNTSEPVLVQELYAFVPASGTLVTDRTYADVMGMPSFLASVAAGDLSYALTYTAEELAAGVDQSQESMLVLGAPDAPGTTDVHAAYNADEADNAFPGPFTNPDVPRTVQVAFAGTWDGGDVTIVGTDQFGNAQTETIADSAGSTVAGAKIFATVTAASKELVGSNTVGASIGYGGILGLSAQLSGTSHLLFADGVAEAGTFDATENSVDPTTAPDGSVEFIAMVKVG